MEKMIDTIMEMDKKARLREQEAEVYKEEQLKALDGKLREIDEKYRAYTVQQIAEITRENEDLIQRKKAQIRAQDEKASAVLEEVYRAGKDAWVSEIVKRALAGE